MVGLEAGYDPLIIAAGNGHVDIVRILTLAGELVDKMDISQHIVYAIFSLSECSNWLSLFCMSRVII